MPELPEVQTTVTGLQKVLVGLTISDVWSDMWSNSSLAKNTIKDHSYFPYFTKYVHKTSITGVRRRAKYILIDLDNGFTIIIHMKMTGHLMYGIYEKNMKSNGKEWSWLPTDNNKALLDPYNRHIHVVFTLTNAKKNSVSHLAFCDSRKFGTMVVEKTSTLHLDRLSHLGPEPLDSTFTFKQFQKRLLKSPTRALKTVLMDQTIISGIGNIYSDEIVHASHVLPTRISKSLTEKEFKLLFSSMKTILRKGIDFGGDSMSDYRNVQGERGAFQKKHLVYLRTKEKCFTKGCKGVIKKETISGRSAHYCPVCQK